MPQDDEKAAVGLAAPPGIDTAKGLDNTMNDPAFYRRILRLFQQDQGDFIRKFMEAEQLGDHREAYRLAHTLKGVAATIGADSLHDAARRLEQGCRQQEKEEDCAELLRQTAAELEQVLRGIDALLAD
jgi:HPt (histidine-containing phosphotransfer) domain-containing protein